MLKALDGLIEVGSFALFERLVDLAEVLEVPAGELLADGEEP